MTFPDLSFVDLRLIEYSQALSTQKYFWQKRVNGDVTDTIIFCEHPAVLTIGKHGNVNNLLTSNSTLKIKKIELFRIERGGDITFHGPGQLIAYPIVKLHQPLISIKQFINKLEQIIINTLSAFNISTIRKPKYIGVWVKDKKIASIGIAVTKHVTFHGLALNVSTDLSFFEMINPCGHEEITMTSMEKILQQKVPIKNVQQELQNQFIKILLPDIK